MKNLLFLLLSLMTSAVIAQKKSATILKIQDKTFSVDEFKYVYLKNNQLSQNPISKSEYLNLFVNYKLKVTDAIAQGLDTTSTFKNEFSYYKDELAKPYLSDKKTEELVIAEAYTRLQTEIEASHILIQIPKGATPTDTLAAFNKINEINQKIANGSDFGEMALEFSEDPSAKQNKGYLGYFTGFQMVYPFESGAYNTPVGQVSPIVRTAYGYHLIKVINKRPAQGELLTAHIMKMFPYGSEESAQKNAKQAIDSLYQLVLKGEDFGELAKANSDDHNSAQNNGQMPWFKTGQMIPEFAEPAFALTKNGEVSKPIKTAFGWHIIKRIDKKGIAPLDSMHEDIKQKIGNDERAYSGKKVVVAEIKEKTNFVVMPNQLSQIAALASQSNITDSIFYAQLGVNEEPICSFAKTSIPQKQFVEYLKKDANFTATSGGKTVENSFNSFTEGILIEYKKERLVQDVPDYRYLLSEYYDGLLIFEVSQKTIWNKAASDSSGVASFYDKNKANYPKPEQWSGVIYYFKNNELLNKIKPLLTDNIEANDSIIAQTNLTKADIYITKNSYFKNENTIIDATYFNDTTKALTYPTGYEAAIAKGKVNGATIYKLDEIRGQILSDYQVELEKNWIEQLKKTYEPVVYPKQLSKIKN